MVGNIVNYFCFLILLASVHSCGYAIPANGVVSRVRVYDKRIEREGAVVVVDHLEYDFGVIWAGEPMSHAFLFRNVGTETAYVRITPGYSGWGMEKYFQIEPGWEHVFEASLRSWKFNGPFEKLYSVDLLPPGERCAMCGFPLESVGHIRRCGPICPNP